MARTIEQRLADLEKTVMNFFTGKKKPARKAAKTTRASKANKMTRKRPVKKARKSGAARA